jgi:signal transduction histidine kinase
MRPGNRLKILLLLGTCGLVFLLVQGLLVVRSLDLARGELRSRALAEAEDAFYRLPFQSEALDRLGDEALDHPGRVEDGTLGPRVQEALAGCAEFDGVLRRNLDRAGLRLPLRSGVVVDTLVFRDGRRKAVPVVDHGALLLAGNGAAQDGPPVTSFFFMGRTHYLRVDLHLQFPRLTLAALLRLKGLLAICLLSLLAFLGACWAILRTLRAQERLAALQTDFIDAMTHELNTPLSTITVAARTLRHQGLGADPGAVDRLADVILRQMERLRTLVRQVAGIASLEVPVLEREAVRFHPLLAGAAEDARAGHGDRGTIVREDYQAADDRVEVDAALVLGALANLLDNAVKYSEGAPEIVLRTWNQGGCLKVSVEDRGVGVDRRHLPSLFGKFYRAPGRGPARGLGLGLYAVDRVMRAHGGHAAAALRRGGGMAFTLSFPLSLPMGAADHA